MNVLVSEAQYTTIDHTADIGCVCRATSLQLLFEQCAVYGFLREGIIIGILWYVIPAVIDLVMFGFGPEQMRMSFVDYMKDIGITYLMIPVITIGFGYILQIRLSRNTSR